MKAEELRIGNYVLGASGEMQRVAYITECIGLHNNIGGTDKYQKNPIFSYDINDLRPIPLTPEILERYGFEDVGGLGKLIISDEVSPTSLQYMFGGGTIQICRSGINALTIPCEYLHQLQNLYFALTGSELTSQTKHD